MALGINQVTYSDRKFCRSLCLSWFCYFRHFQVSQDDEIWQAYQGPDQIKLKIVVFESWPSGGRVGGRLIPKKQKKISIFNLRMGDWILMKFDVWKNSVSQCSYFKSRPDPVKEKWGGEPKILENAQSGGIGVKLGGKNKHKSQIRV